MKKHVLLRKLESVFYSIIVFAAIIGLMALVIGLFTAIAAVGFFLSETAGPALGALMLLVFLAVCVGIVAFITG